jgi:cytosine/uracil/thiamine/allantoin permease
MAGCVGVYRLIGSNAFGLAYAIGIAVSLPFVNNAAYQGSASALVDGADISWIPGLIVTGAVYLIFTATNRVKS